MLYIESIPGFAMEVAYHMEWRQILRTPRGGWPNGHPVAGSTPESASFAIGGQVVWDSTETKAETIARLQAALDVLQREV